MSLLDKIAQRNSERSNMAAGAEQEEAAIAAMPDAGASAASGRKNYSDAIASGPDQEMADEPASPEEQAEFTKIERAMAEVVYGEKASDSIVQTVQAAQDPVEGVGKAAADLVNSLDKKFGMSEDVMFAAGEAAVEQIVDLMESTGSGVNLNEDQMAEALSIGVTTWMDNNSQAVDPEMMQYMNEEPPAQL